MSLSEFSYYLRKFGPIAVLGLILFVLFFMIISLGVKSLTSRPVQTVFVPAFGQLTPINFSVKVEYPPSPEFTIDNIEGRPTTATRSADIFYIPPPSTRFGYVQNILLMAKAVGFNTSEEKYSLNGTAASFENATQKLDVDIRNFNFTFDTKLETQPDIFNSSTIPPEQVISEQAKAFLRRMDRFPDGLAQGKEHIIYLRYEPVTKEYTVVEKIEDANVVEIDYFPPDVSGFPVVVPKYFNSQNYVVMVFAQQGSKGVIGRVVKAQIKYFEKNPAGNMYPVKTGDEAWTDLTSGKGTIVSAGQNSNKITVRQMFLGYYEPELYQDFFQPVYVFLGDNNFAAYVPAVTNMYVATDSAKAAP